MKAVIFYFIMLCYCTGYAQLSVQSTFTENKLLSHLYPSGFEDVSQDLFFSIGPNGLPQYGQDVSWNLNENTSGLARYFHVKKGDWDRSAIRNFTDQINFTVSDNLFPPEDTPNVHMGTNWIKLGNSWNFSHDNYNIAIISFTNQGEKPLEKGIIKFSHPSNSFISIQDFYIYNDWIQFVDDSNVSNTKTYEFQFENLEPGEIRHLYIKVDISQKSSFSIPPTQFEVEMVGYQSDFLFADGIIPPHDPNELTLLTALENTDPIYNCEHYDHIPELGEICRSSQLFWVLCRQEGSLKCPIEHSIHYPYCNNDSELLTYRITCLNDGQGIAKHIEMDAKFDLNFSPFDMDIFNFEGSHYTIGSFDYPIASFLLNEINLPGLNDNYTVYTYDECSAQVEFQVKTLCNINEKIRTVATITFQDLNEVEVEEVQTNTIYIVPEQGVYNNYDPLCIPCGENAKKMNSSMDEDLTLFWSNSSLDISLERINPSSVVKLIIYDISGRIIKNLDVQPNGSTHLIEQINTSNLSSGIYFLSIQNGSDRFVKKFINP